MTRRKPINHGTIGGNRAHFRHGEPMCEPCRDAERRRRGFEPMKTAQCGTLSGYRQHTMAGEPTCTACRAAHASYRRQRRRAGLPDGDPRHGTANGYSNWGCKCEACRAAGSADNAARRAHRTTRTVS